MPPRVARSSVQGSASAKSSSSAKQPNARNPRKAAKRALNAFAIAQYENPEKLKIRKNRLGETDPAFNRKRGRENDEDDEEEGEGEDEDGPKRRKRRSGSESFDEGSDSEGNTWQMGHVEDDDDEDIDSDEAFGESDEERFEGYTFRGSSTMQKKKGHEGKGKREMELGSDVDMDEGDSADGEDEDDDLGEDAIDLATALDQYDENEREEKREREKKRKEQSAFGDSDSDESPSEEEDMGADGADDLTSDDDDEEDDEERQAQLNDLISSLAAQEESKAKGRKVQVLESAVPDEFGVSRKVDLLSLKPKVADAEKKRALKLLSDDKSSRRNDIARKLDAPLPKRQQDKLDRAAANAKANETLERWTDTIKSNRRAEHLIFPLQHKDQGEVMGERTLVPTTTAAPANDLESTIQSILQQSGLSNGKDDEEAIQKWEQLQTNKLPIEEVMKRRAQLRMERELLFREEVRAKRIKKIKSKSYRRVHRKEREKLLEKERQALKDDGVDLSEEEREYNDRRRAEERMGAKHRESKWAKGIKATGRAGWDKDALDGVTEMARRNEELRRRVEGKTIRDEEDEGSDVPTENSSDDDEDQSDAEVLQKSLSKIKQNPFSTDKSKLGQMAFMQKAEASKRAQNDEAEEALRRELAGEESQSEEDDNATRAGRRKYGPGGQVAAPAIQITRGEFEEHESGDEEAATAKARNQAEETRDASEGASRNAKKAATGGLSNGTRKTQKSSALSPADNEAVDANPFLSVMKKAKKTEKEPDLFVVQGNSQPSTAKAAKAQPKPKPKANAKPQAKSKPADSAQETTIDDFLQQRVTAADDDGWATIVGGQDDEQDEDVDDANDSDLDLETLRRNQALTSKGFAGDNVAAEFAQEKKATVAEEASSETIIHLPGWGAWTGDSLTPAQKKRNLGATTITKKDGIEASKRKDRKLDKVIINEKRVKPNVAYMATQLPFPFETKEQYERSLRLPKGKEWTTKRTHQQATKPRVIVKQGVIGPLRKPLV